MVWVMLLGAGALEVVWAVLLKQTQGFTRLWPSLACAAAMAGSLGLLGLALRELPISVGYAVWVGIGAIGTAIWGIAVWQEPAGAIRIACLSLIVVGIIGLKLDHG